MTIFVVRKNRKQAIIYILILSTMNMPLKDHSSVTNGNLSVRKDSLVFSFLDETSIKTCKPYDLLWLNSKTLPFIVDWQLPEKVKKNTTRPLLIMENLKRISSVTKLY